MPEASAQLRQGAYATAHSRPRSLCDCPHLLVDTRPLLLRRRLALCRVLLLLLLRKHVWRRVRGVGYISSRCSVSLCGGSLDLC